MRDRGLVGFAISEEEDNHFYFIRLVYNSIYAISYSNYTNEEESRFE